jgi:hypothetical protein
MASNFLVLGYWNPLISSNYIAINNLALKQAAILLPKMERFDVPLCAITQKTVVLIPGPSF